MVVAKSRGPPRIIFRPIAHDPVPARNLTVLPASRPARCPLSEDIVAKVFFALVIKNSPGCRRDLPDDKLTGDLGSVIETTQIGGRRSDRLMAGKLSRAILDFYNSICQKRKSAI